MACFNAIAANLKALQALLSVAAARSAEAHQLIQDGECNGAIGTVLELDRILDDANVGNWGRKLGTDLFLFEGGLRQVV